MVLFGLHNRGHTHVWYLGYTYIKQFRELGTLYLGDDEYPQVVFNGIALTVLHPVFSCCKIIHAFIEYPAYRKYSKNMNTNHHALHTRGTYIAQKEIKHAYLLQEF